jgi:hypothetical protein
VALIVGSDRAIALVLTTVSLALLVPIRAHACTCIDGDDGLKRIGKYPVIFLGEATDETVSEHGLVNVKFRAVRVWKGKPKDFVVRASANPEACGYRFARGRYYVVFAYSEGWMLATNRCTPTELVAAASDTIRLLDKRFHVRTPVSTEMLAR